jgi:hypothetical protein
MKFRTVVVLTLAAALVATPAQLNGAAGEVVVSLSIRGSAAAFTLVSVSVRVSPFVARAALTTGGDRPSSAGWHSALP